MGLLMKLFDEEMQDKIKKGLCVKCDEKFGTNHVYINKQLHMLLIIKEDIFEYDEILDDKMGKEDGDSEVGKGLQLSMLAGHTTKKSQKVWRRIENEKVVVF